MYVKNNKNFYKYIYEYAYSHGYYKNPHYLCGSYILNYIIDNMFRYEFNTVIDIGCAKGKAVETLNRKYKRAIGIDISEIAIKEGKKLKRNLLVANMLDIPFSDSHFDLVLCMNIFEHIKPSDIDIAISEIFRVSKKYIAVQINTGKSLFLEPFKGINGYKDFNPHLSIHSIGNWKRKLLENRNAKTIWEKGNMFIAEKM